MNELKGLLGRLCELLLLSKLHKAESRPAVGRAPWGLVNVDGPSRASCQDHKPSFLGSSE